MRLIPLILAAILIPSSASAACYEPWTAWVHTQSAAREALRLSRPDAPKLQCAGKVIEASYCGCVRMPDGCLSKDPRFAGTVAGPEPADCDAEKG